MGTKKWIWGGAQVWAGQGIGNEFFNHGLTDGEGWGGQQIRSAIEPPPTGQDNIFERGLESFDAIDFLSRFNQHVLGHPQSAQAAVRTL